MLDVVRYSPLAKSDVPDYVQIGPNLTLGTMTDRHIQDIVDVLRIVRATGQSTFLPRTSARLSSPKDVARFLDRSYPPIDDCRLTGGIWWHGRFIGYLALSIFRHDRLVEIDYLVAPTSRALRLFDNIGKWLRRFFFLQHGFARLDLCCDVRDTFSAHIAGALGLAYELTLGSRCVYSPTEVYDADLYSLTRTDLL